MPRGGKGGGGRGREPPGAQSETAATEGSRKTSHVSGRYTDGYARHVKFTFHCEIHT